MSDLVSSSQVLAGTCCATFASVRFVSCKSLLRMECQKLLIHRCWRRCPKVFLLAWELTVSTIVTAAGVSAQLQGAFSTDLPLRRGFTLYWCLMKHPGCWNRGCIHVSEMFATYYGTAEIVGHPFSRTIWNKTKFSFFLRPLSNSFGEETFGDYG